MKQIDTVWESVLGELEVSLSEGQYNTFFRQTKLIRQEDDQFVIGVKNVFHKDNLNKKYIDVVEAVLKEKGFRNAHVRFDIYSPGDSGSNKSKRKGKEEEFIQIDLQSNTNKSIPDSIKPGTERGAVQLQQGLNSRYTFDNFVTGGSNELAYAACQAIAAQPGTKYNPLFVYGGVGIGKTHLIQAVGNEVLKNNPDASVVYITSEQFLKEFTEAIRYKKVGAFSAAYRSCDVLIVDDIQFIAGKEKTEEEFFHTFNVLHQANKQVIFSSDKPPHAIPTLQERLKSRFQMGMSIDMQSPDFETRVAILQSKASNLGMDLNYETAEFLSNNFPTNIRELEGALNKLLAFCELRSIQPSLDVAEQVFAGISRRKRRLIPKTIIEKVAKYYNLDMSEITGPRRDKDIVLPRQVAMYLLREELSMSFPKIARALGRKDHTTALHSVDKITKEVVVDLILREQIQDIREELRA